MGFEREVGLHKPWLGGSCARQREWHAGGQWAEAGLAAAWTAGGRVCLVGVMLSLSHVAHSLQGAITVKGLVDREKGDFYTLTVVADDGGPKADSTVVSGPRWAPHRCPHAHVLTSAQHAGLAVGREGRAACGLGRVSPQAVGRGGGAHTADRLHLCFFLAALVLPTLPAEGEWPVGWGCPSPSMWPGPFPPPLQREACGGSPRTPWVTSLVHPLCVWGAGPLPPGWSLCVPPRGPKVGGALTKK